MNTVLSPEAIKAIKATDFPMPVGYRYCDAEAIAVAKSQDAHTRLELAKAVREMSPINAVGFQQAFLKLLEQ